MLKCREEPPKLLGCKFQERYFVIQEHKLLLLKEKRSARPEREWPLDMAKVYMGIRKKLKPPSQWGFTLVLDKQQLSLACAGQAELWDWTTSILKAQHDGLRPVVMRRRSSSDLARQKFGTMPLVPLQGDSTDASLLSANQTLRRLHARRTLSMFFPMKMHQDSVEEQQAAEAAVEPVYEEVGEFLALAPPRLDAGPLLALAPVPAVDASSKPALPPEQPPSRSPERRGPGAQARSLSLERGLDLDPEQAPEWDRAPGLRAAQAGSLERAEELPAPRSRELLALPLAPAASPEPPQEGARKRSAQLASPASERLMQELSSRLLRKSEGPAPGPGQQVT